MEMIGEPLKISEIPTAALVETYEKYQKALYAGTILWVECALSKYINELFDIKNDSACRYCPLFEPGWCRSMAYASKLSPLYHDKIAKVIGNSGRRTVGNIQWEISVAGYLKWITTELVRRNVYTKLRRLNVQS
jgi:hypothetical protein